MDMRVIAGKAKGRKLNMSDQLPVRPTSDKVKGGVFNMLASLVPDCSFLDLFAGSGAMGIEAWSRGAEQVVFVEKNRRVYSLLQKNLQTVGFCEANCMQTDFSTAALRLAGKKFDIIYADPPYWAELYPKIIETVRERQLLSADGVLALEHPKGKQLFTLDECWKLLQQKVYGDTMITFLQESDR
jgi:16S rRNA (guanine966-N2)-methyltransferase